MPTLAGCSRNSFANADSIRTSEPTVDPSQLPIRDIHLPGLIAWWPPAPGWWLVAAFALAALAGLALYYHDGRHRRTALRSLASVRAALEQGAEPVACLQRVSTTLRRYAMTTADEQSVAALRAVDGIADRPSSDEVAGLIGQRWLRYLDSRWQRDEFSHGGGRLLLAAPYARPDTIERAHAIDLAALCAEWLKAQRTHARSPVRRRAARGRFGLLAARLGGGG
jgi:uncharacterized protein DUF4381